MASSSSGEPVYLVTGAYGCIGSWVIRELSLRGRPVVAVDVAPASDRFKLVTHGVDLENVTHAVGVDIRDASAVRALFDQFDVERVIHLAALQVPFCRANPPDGYSVNIVGTANLFEAALAADRQVGLVYTSSIGVYGPSEAPTKDPMTHYGVTKLANELMADVYWHEAGLASAGLRPYVVYGPGRDQGMTASPTQAMAAALLERPFSISFGGSFQMHFVRDVAVALIAAADRVTHGSSCADLGGPAISMADVVAAIDEIVPGAATSLTFAGEALPFPADVPSDGLSELTGGSPLTPLVDGVRSTLDFWRSAIAQRPQFRNHLEAML